MNSAQRIKEAIDGEKPIHKIVIAVDNDSAVIVNLGNRVDPL